MAKREEKTERISPVCVAEILPVRPAAEWQNSPLRRFQPAAQRAKTARRPQRELNQRPSKKVAPILALAVWNSRFFRCFPR
jgi:hypothetical protein